MSTPHEILMHTVTPPDIPATMRDIRSVRTDLTAVKERVRYLEEIVEVLLKRFNDESR